MCLHIFELKEHLTRSSVSEQPSRSSLYGTASHWVGVSWMDIAVLDCTKDCVVARCKIGNTPFSISLTSMKIPKNYLESTAMIHIKKIIPFVPSYLMVYLGVISKYLLFRWNCHKSSRRIGSHISDGMVEGGGVPSHILILIGRKFQRYLATLSARPHSTSYCVCIKTLV